MVLHIPQRSQFLHHVVGFLVLRPAAAFGYLRRLEFVDDLVNRVGVGIDRPAAGLTADAAEAFAVFGEIEARGGDILSFDVFPDIDLSPAEEWVDAYMFLFGGFCLVLVP